MKDSVSDVIPGNSPSPRRTSGSVTRLSLQSTSLHTSVARRLRSHTQSLHTQARLVRVSSSLPRRVIATRLSQLVSCPFTRPPTSRRPASSSSPSVFTTNLTPSRHPARTSVTDGTSPSRSPLSLARHRRRLLSRARLTRLSSRSLVSLILVDVYTLANDDL